MSGAGSQGLTRALTNEAETTPRRNVLRTRNAHEED